MKKACIILKSTTLKRGLDANADQLRNILAIGWPIFYRCKNPMSIRHRIFMDIKTALDTAFNACTQFHSFKKHSTFLDPSIIDGAFVEAGVATVRKRRLPLESVMWCVMGMSLFRQKSVWNIATKMDIALHGKAPLVAPSAMVQARQRLGTEAVEKPFKKMARHWYQQNGFDTWTGLNLLGVDGVVWRTANTTQIREK